MPDTHETARAMVQRAIAAADGDTRVAALNLAALMDVLMDEQRKLVAALGEHLAECPQITPMRPREAVTR